MARSSRTSGKTSVSKTRKPRGARGRNPGRSKGNVAQTTLRSRRSSGSGPDKELKEAREQQAATSEVLEAIKRSGFDLDGILQTVVSTAARLCNTGPAGIFLLEGEVYRFRAGQHLSEAYREHEKRSEIRAGLGTVVGRVALEKGVVHIVDALNDNEYEDKEAAAANNLRSMLGVPLLRDGKPVGVFALARTRVEPFSESQIGLVTTFANQAVIAIENARLFNEVQARTRDLQESLQQQTATADVLKVISRSAFDLDSILLTLVESAAKLCEADKGVIFLREGDYFRLACNYGFSAEFEDHARRHPLPADGPSTTARAAASGKPTQASFDSVGTSEYRRLGGFLTNLGVPLRQKDEVIGVFTLTRPQPQPFTERQIELVSTFADQAVIAIENTRLFNETQEALEHQTATSEILETIGSSMADTQPVFERILDSVERLFAIRQCAVMLAAGDGMLHLAARRGIGVEAMDRFYPVPLAQTMAGNVVETGQQTYVASAASALASPLMRRVAETAGDFSVVLTPMLWEGRGVGVINLSRGPNATFSEKELALLRTFADQAVIAIQNARLFNETKEALARQTATSDVLKVIASSPSNLQPVFDAIAERSKALIGGHSTTVVRYLDGVVELASFTPISPEADATLQALFPMRPDTDPQFAPILRGEIAVIGDAESELQNTAMRESARARGWRSRLLVPLKDDTGVIGWISITRREAGGFADKDVELLQTFADQAVIAIKNVELFEEVQERTRELSKSLDDLRTAQDRLIQTEKLASLGQLTAGIAHEIKNPLNFVNNFSALSVELTDELNDVLRQAELAEAIRKETDELTGMLKDNLSKVVQHGKRADSIVKNMLLHSREGSREQRPADVNALVEESLNLAYHGARAEKSGFEITLQRDLDANAGIAEVFPQEVSRALLNLISNGFYAATKRKIENGGAGFVPAVLAITRDLGCSVEIRIRDNGTGIPPEVREKIFNPFFTTKPTGEGTGLGLSMTHDIIVKQHGGKIDVDTKVGEFTEFIITLPRNNRPAAG